MKLDIYYDAETDTLSLWNGLPASEGEDVADNLVADFGRDGCVVGFTLEHAGEVLQSDLSALTDLSGGITYDEIKDSPSTNGRTVFDKLKSAFPDLYYETKGDHNFCFYRGATIYVRKTKKEGLNTARIHSLYMKNFPNGQELAHYVEKHGVPKDPSKSHPDFKFGLEHVDDLICILKDVTK